MNTTLDFVLEGKVFLEERENGILINRTEMPADAILQVLINIVEESVAKTLLDRKPSDYSI